MRRRLSLLLLVAPPVLAASAVSCNTVLGIDTLPGPGEASNEPGEDSSVDVSIDSTSYYDADGSGEDAAPETLNAADSVPDADTAADSADAADSGDAVVVDAGKADTTFVDSAAGDSGSADTSATDGAGTDTGLSETSDATTETETGGASCTGVTCASPPPATCATGTTLRTYAPLGTCSSGACSYAPADTPCWSGTTCIAGACTAGAGTPPSCAAAGDGLNNCGPSGAESCCTSLLVTGVATASFSRSYDGVTSGYTDPQYKAQVADFKLDKYEITVGRFRKYVAAVVGGWKPTAGSGKHTHLPGGGLNGGAEPGWDATNWNTAANFPTAQATWDGTGYLTHPNCAGYASWTPSAGSNEKKPINCLDWYDAAAFCIWDGGFLPSEAEWNYAASGGTEQRKYPWPATSGEPGANANLAIYGCYYNGTGSCTGVTNLAPVGTVPAGNGKYGQSDLAGNVFEWTLDWYKGPYSETACTNCSYLVASSGRVIRGGSFYDGASYLLAGYRYFFTPTGRGFTLGARCARTP
jgi:formylglycine-generating enzyme required for sulfatase activity